MTVGRTAARRGPVLCCADSNIAVAWLVREVFVGVARTPLKSTRKAASASQVDNLVAGCAKAGLKVVRIGRPEATRYDLEKYNLLEMVKAAGLKRQAIQAVCI